VRIDFHTHIVPPLPDFGARFGDHRWPAFEVDGSVGRLSRGGRVVRTVPPSSWSPASRIEDMQAAGIDRQVLSPLPPIICDWAEGDRATEWCNQLNDGIAGIVAAHPDRFHGLGTVPLQHPDRAVDVLVRARDAGLVGVEVGTTGGALEFDDPKLVEFFAAADQLGMIVYVHPLILGTEAGWTPRITGAEVTFGLGMGSDTAIAAAKLAFGGVTQACPGLRVCLAHGGGTFGWALPRIAHLWDDSHDRPAAELIANMYVDSVVYRPANVRYLCDSLGADRVVFGTDYPLPAQDDMRGGVLERLDAKEAELVWAGNARVLLGMDTL
jgi:aminocarboxymuconate-semialdehyde decarboxylase